MVNVAVLGYGTVGSGVYEVLTGNKKVISERVGDEVNVKYVLDLREFPGDPVESVLVHDFDIILNDPEVDIVAEAMGGLNPAYKFAKATLEAGKNYCTSNKELVAKYGPELIALAEKMNKNFLFEASVGGGIPIIRPLNESLTADNITEISGILNGTTNFILTKMDREGSSFDDVLKEAQALGYAEKDPTADVEGYDACRKIAILSSLAYGSHVDFEDIYTEGITKITDVDFKYTKKMNKSIKLFGKSKKVNGNVYAMVAPFMIDAEHPLYSVNGVKNGILCKGPVIDDIMFYGSGAGKLPTASAVVADVIEEARYLNSHIKMVWKPEKIEISDIKTDENKYFVRIEGNADAKLAEVKAAFGEVEVVTVDDVTDEFAVVTGVMTQEAYDVAAAKVAGVRQRIRMA